MINKTKAVIFDMYETLITHYECPLFFSSHMAEMAGIPVERFRSTWRNTDEPRSTGRISFEEILETILKENGRYSEALFREMVKIRIKTKQECFEHLHEEIIPMLEGLKGEGCRIGLISNCFSEEAEVIKKSLLYKYFDAPCLSYEIGYKKPDERIFRICMEMLNAAPDECIYVGDGGSMELETAERLGMKPFQALWYMKEGNPSVVEDKRFKGLRRPMEIMKFLSSEGVNKDTYNNNPDNI